MAFHGLFIGIDKHASDEIGELTCAARDARALHGLFADTLGEAQAQLLCDERATRTAIKSQFQDRLTQVAADDVVVVTFSGHGSDDHHLITHDADPTHLGSTAIPLDELVEWFKAIPARNAILILDCCFSGGAGAKVFHRTVKMRGVAASNDLFTRFSGTGRLILTACTPEQEAIEDSVRRHGLLTYYLMEGLRGAPEVVDSGRIRLYPLLEYVSRSVREAASAFDHEQDPSFRGTVDGDVTFPILAPGSIFAKAFPEYAATQVTSAIDDLAAFGLPEEVLSIWRQTIPGLNTLQQRAINDFGLLVGEHLVVSAPTSSGKTMLGELVAMQRYFDGRKSLFLLPMKALVNDKYDDFVKRYGTLGVRVVRATGEHHDDNANILRGHYDLCLMTYEKASSFLLQNPHVMRQVGLVVIDEVQMLADRSRGSNLEFLLTLLRSRRRYGIQPQLLALSAVIGDMRGFDKWLGAGLLRTNERPVPLLEGLMKGDGSFRHLDAHGVERVESAFIRPQFAKNSSQDYVIPLVRRLVAQNEKVIVFRETTSEARSVAAYLARELTLPPDEDLLRELESLDPSAATAGLRESVSHGVAFHNSNLDRSERSAIERSFRSPTSRLRVIVATTTLAMGVNTPASSVVIVGLTHPGDEPYSVAEYKNMVGRAGRLGFSEEGKSFLLAKEAGDEYRYWSHFVLGSPEDLESRFASTDMRLLVIKALAAATKSRVGSMSRETVVTFLESSFGAFQQAESGGPSWQPGAIESAVNELLAHKMLDEEDADLRLTEIGQVTAEGGISIESALRLVRSFAGVSPADITETAMLGAVQTTVELDAVLMPTHKTSVQERARWRGVLSAQSLPATVRSEFQRSAADDAALTARAKRYAAALMWVQGEPLGDIEASLLYHMPRNEAAGAIRAVADRSRDVLATAGRIAGLMNGSDATVAANAELLGVRLAFGVTRAMSPLARVMGAELRRGQYLALERAGLVTREAIDASSDEALTKLLSDAGATARLRTGVVRWDELETASLERARIEGLLPKAEV